MTPPPIDPKLAALLGLAATATACDRSKVRACLSPPYDTGFGPCLSPPGDSGDTGEETDTGHEDTGLGPCLSQQPDTGDTADTGDGTEDTGSQDTGATDTGGTADSGAQDTGETPDTGATEDGHARGAEGTLDALREAVRQKLHGTGILPEDLFGEPAE